MEGAYQPLAPSSSAAVAPMDALIQRNLEALRQVAALVLILDDRVFRQGTDDTSPVGTHVRHILDFYTCLFRDLSCGCINYQDRPREHDVESDRQAAVSTMQAVEAELIRLRRARPTTPLQVVIDPSPFDSSNSTISRELQFLFSHTIHHFATIAVLLRQHGIPVPS